MPGPAPRPAVESPMRTTLALDDALVRRARELTDIKDTSALVREALEALIQREAARRLALLGGTMPALADIPRRRSSPAGTGEADRGGCGIGGAGSAVGWAVKLPAMGSSLGTTRPRACVGMSAIGQCSFEGVLQAARSKQHRRPAEGEQDAGA